MPEGIWIFLGFVLIAFGVVAPRLARQEVMGGYQVTRAVPSAFTWIAVTVGFAMIAIAVFAIVNNPWYWVRWDLVPH